MHNWFKLYALFFLLIINGGLGWVLNPKRSVTRLNAEFSRTKQNKYSQFSKISRDPLDIAIENAELLRKTLKPSSSMDLRGTTVPVTPSSSVPKGSSNKTTSLPFEVNAVDPTDAYTFGFVEIGKILGPHGVKGELKVRLEKDYVAKDMNVLEKQTIFVKKSNRRTPRSITITKGRRVDNNLFLINFEGVQSRVTAEAFKEYTLYSRRGDQSEQVDGGDEYMIRDLVNVECFFPYTDINSAKRIGVVHSVVPPEDLCAPSVAHLMHALLEVKLENSKRKNDLCYIPFVNQIVTTIGIGTPNAMIIIDPPLGLLDLTHREEIKCTIRGHLPSEATISPERRENLLSSS